MERFFSNVEYSVINGNLDRDIKNITIDSRTANQDSLFVCLDGSNFDGHDYIMDAYKLGCRCFVVEKDIDISNIKDANIIKVDNTRKALSYISQSFYRHPANDLITIAITGTKGKTTTASMIKKILEDAGHKCGMIGTLGVFIGDKHYKTLNTTPESLDIQYYFRQMADEGCKYAIMEVSSQALKVGRVEGMTFVYGIFTNLSEEHIGENEHKNYEAYRDCKAKLFKQCRVGILNKDDIEFKNMINDSTCEINSFGINKDADYKVSSYNFLNSNGKIGMSFKINSDEYEIYTPGKFSIYNALAAISLCKRIKIPTKIIKKSLEDFKIKGRVEPIKISDDYTVLIDYAHEAMSLESLILTMKEYNPNRIITLFGCGGNRSRNRRFEMGEISGKYSDLTIITEDNSRFESFSDIAKDIQVGINKTNGKYVVVENRKEAIKYALKNACKDDIILLCGKGHEDYQEINGKRYHMDERELIEEILLEFKNEDIKRKTL